MKKIGMIIIALLMISLTGCMNEYELSEVSTDVVAEYMAGVLLDQDENYQRDLLNEEELNMAEEEKDAQDNPAKEEASAEEDDGTDSSAKAENNESQVGTGAGTTEQGQEFTISEVIGTEDFNITYDSYKLCSVYPEDESNAYFSLTPLDGNQLIVVNFTAENITDKKKRLDLRKSKVAYRLDINVGTIYEPLLTLLENNLKYIDISVSGGKKEEVLLIFEVSKNLDLKDINLIISNGPKTEIIDIK